MAQKLLYTEEKRSEDDSQNALTARGQCKDQENLSFKEKSEALKTC